MRTASISIDGELPVPMSLKEKTFRSGSRGFYVWGKVEDEEGKRYQVICNLVEIGSKPT